MVARFNFILPRIFPVKNVVTKTSLCLLKWRLPRFFNFSRSARLQWARAAGTNYSASVSNMFSSQFDLACDSLVNKATEKCIYSGKCVLYIIHIYGSSEKAGSSCFVWRKSCDCTLIDHGQHPSTTYMIQLYSVCDKNRTRYLLRYWEE